MIKSKSYIITVISFILIYFSAYHNWAYAQADDSLASVCNIKTYAWRWQGYRTRK